MPERYRFVELRHLRYFIAIAEEGSLTVAAVKRLHTAQPSLSRQMHDLEAELGCALMIRGARGIELTAAGRVLLDHARVVLAQVEAATEATRRAAAPAKMSFVLGFLTGHEFEWLPAVMAIMRDELPNTQVIIHSLSSPDLAAGLMRAKIDLAFLRHERNAPGIVFTRLIRRPMKLDCRTPPPALGRTASGIGAANMRKPSPARECLWLRNGAGIIRLSDGAGPGIAQPSSR
jgi:LysR family hca operon transcriptional activator